MAIAPGSHFDRYEVLSVLGVGGMGEVYLARDTRLGRKVAFKTLPAQFTAEAERVRRFEQEARAASALNHPNIVTIFDIGALDGVHFMAAEYIEGESLRQRLQRQRPTLNEALDWTIQAASALSAAHAAGIVHRDIKPDNLMLRGDGVVKVLDFGLAKLAEEARPAVDSEAATLQKITTDPGAVLGTPQYMSPEQARGQKADARSDMFSLGVVLYEMLAGRSPFEGVNAIEMMGAILKSEPAPLNAALTAVPEALAHQLEHIVTKALRKDREQRYQTSKDLLIDLTDLKEELAFAARLERSGQPNKPEPVTAETAAATTAETTATPTTSSAQIILGEVKRHKLGVALTLAALVIAAVAALFYFNRQPVLTDKDTILLADFVNTTGDAVFDGTLKQALAVQLEQSPFLNIFPDQRVRETLRLMSRSPDERVTRDVAREVCERAGVKALLNGTISSLGRNYVILLEAVNARTGDALARAQAEAENKEQVLRALGQMATQLREKLGESLRSVQQFDAPLERATTSSLEALKAYSLGAEQRRQGKWRDAIPFFTRAVELDPNFAMAWYGLSSVYNSTSQRKLSLEAIEKAFALRDRASEIERLRITSLYYPYVDGDQNKTIEVLELWRQTYPREGEVYNLLGNAYRGLGQSEKAVEAYRESIRIRPNYAASYENLAAEFIRLNRFDEAKTMIEQGQARKFDNPNFLRYLFQIAFAQGDRAAVQRYIDLRKGRPDPQQAFDWQAEVAAFAGRMREARVLYLESNSDPKGPGAVQLSQNGLRESVVGKCQQARADTARFLALSRDWVYVLRGASVLSRCGDIGQAQALTDELARDNPRNTAINSIWLPAQQAQNEIVRGNYARAIQILQPASRYESASLFWIPWVRGQAYLKLNQGAEAAVEFQKILNHCGWDPTLMLYPLAHLGLARAAAMQGDTVKARKSYQDFFALWKDADVDLPVLIEAKKEYEKVK